MTATKHRIAALLLAMLMAAAGAIAASSAPVMIDDAHAASQADDFEFDEAKAEAPKADA